MPGLSAEPRETGGPAQWFNQMGHFRAVGRPKLYASVVEQILANIRSGLFPPGSALEHAGVLDIRTGSGTYVATEGGRAPRSCVPRPLPSASTVRST